MRILTTCAAVLCSGLLLNCSGSDDTGSASKDLINTDFDELRGWVDNTVGSLTNQQAHSGRYSLTVGAGREYSLTFKHPLGELTTSKPRKLHLRAWVRIDEATTPVKLIVQITRPVTDETVFRENIPLQGVSEEGKWAELKMDLTMPQEIASDQTLGIYMWANSAAKPVYLDDLRITAAE